MKKLIGFLAVMMVLVVNVWAPSTPDCNKYDATFNSVTDLGDGKYNWSYTVCQGDQWAISHWVLETCNPGTIYDFGSTLSGVTLTYGTDGSSGVTGLKFDSLTWDDDDCEDFWFVTNIGATETKDYMIKPDGVFCYYSGLTGPSCSSTTTTTTSTTTTTTSTTSTTTTTCPTTSTTVPNAPEFASISAILAILLTTPAFAYLVVKKKE